LSGLVGNDIFRGYEIFGGIIGRAALLQALPQGMIQCDGATERAARGSVGFIPFGPTALRGISSAARSLDTGHQRPPAAEMRMHGRAPELAVLFDALAAAQAGGTGIVMVEADSGLGKSRLLTERCQRGRLRLPGARRPGRPDRATGAAPSLARRDGQAARPGRPVDPRRAVVAARFAIVGA